MAVRTGWKVIRTAVVNFGRDEIILRSAAQAFYTVLSLAPLLVLLVTLTSWMGDARRQQIVGRAEAVVGPQASQAIEIVIERAQAKPAAATVSAVIGLAATLLAALGAFAQLQATLNRIFKVRVNRGLVFAWLWKRLLSLLMIVVVAAVLIASVIVTSAVAMMVREGGAVWEVVNIVVSLLVFTAIFMAMFKLLPDAELAWKDTVIGSILTAVLFMAGTYGISHYLGRTGAGSVYGAVGSLVVLLLWVFYSSVIVFFGAELISAYARFRGRAPRPTERAEQVEPALQTQEQT